jgi:putative oxidoreductase
MLQSLRSLNRTLTGLKGYATVPLQLIVGYGFLAHGMAKWNKGPDAFAAILNATHVPAPHIMAWLTIFTEIFGGLAILCGAFVAWVSLPTIVLLIVAILTVHLPYGFTSIKLMKIVDGRPVFGPPGYECDLLYIACILTLVLSGPSPWSVDAYRLRKEGGTLG